LANRHIWLVEIEVFTLLETKLMLAGKVLSKSFYPSLDTNLKTVESMRPKLGSNGVDVFNQVSKVGSAWANANTVWPVVSIMARMGSISGLVGVSSPTTWP
jgi:hypothetical protein